MVHPQTIKKIFLLLATATIFPVAALYGVSPGWFAKAFLGVAPLDHNLAHILRAMMFLYLGFGFFWLFAAFSAKYRNPALLTVAIFPTGLVVGRLVSCVLDGTPAPLLLIYLVIELIQAPLAFLVFRLPENHDK